MTSSKKQSSTRVATYADHEVIHPKNKMRELVNARRLLPGKYYPIVRGDKALADLSTEFSSWMNSDCERLDMARRNIAGKFTAGDKVAIFHMLPAHDIKGQAAMFGFPLVALAAGSLCRLIQQTPDLTNSVIR